jgi:UDP-N-acetylmuramoyl-tripeptide--D-alanyl-D-alanine ligase
MNALDVLALAAAMIAASLASVRWLRVAQREHYLPGSATRFALRWWLGFGPNRVLLVAAVLGVVLSPASSLTAVVASLAVAAGPFRLSFLGRSPGRIAWTRRLRSVAFVVAALTILPVLVAALLGAAVPIATLVALINPLLVDLALALLRPLEDHLAERYVTEAKSKLAQVAPIVVGITGSYGKTSTKVYAAHLAGRARRVVPTPKSFNNRAGLSKAINEHLVPGTDVFIAEMGTYGPGEIAEMCAWCPPQIAAITAIGPVHLERFGSEDAIVAAKSEIFDAAQVAVLNVDDPRLARVADQQEARRLRVWRCSSLDAGADVWARVEGGRLRVSSRGALLADVADPGAPAGNVAVATAIALELGVPGDAVGAGIADLPAVASRQAVTPLSTGAAAIDDTFNSNPAGSRAALAKLSALGTPDGKRVIVTPGMVELGPRQRDENRAFAGDAAPVATHVLIVGWTNRRALLAGLAGYASGRSSRPPRRDAGPGGGMGTAPYGPRRRRPLRERPPGPLSLTVHERNAPT